MASSLVPNNCSTSRKYGRPRTKDKGAYSNVGVLREYYKGSEIQNNTSTARVYVFGDDHQVADDENVVFEMPELKMRSRSKGASGYVKLVDLEEEQPEYFVKEIADGETLQAIALKYACPISELKRLNKLIQDQEFFALKVVKVPMKKHGIIREEIANEATNSKHLSRSATSQCATATLLSSDTEVEHYSNYFEESDSQHDFSDPETQLKIMRTLSIRDNISSQGKDAEQFLKKMDDDLRKLKLSSRYERESLSEVISVLTNKSIHPLQTNRPSDKQSGATCVVSWWTIICVSFIVGIVFPVVLFLYIKYVLNSH